MEAFPSGSYEGTLEKILYRDPEKTFWPGIKVEYLYCANSPWSMVCGADTVQERFEGAVPGRKIKVMAQANHFVST